MKPCGQRTESGMNERFKAAGEFLRRPHYKMNSISTCSRAFWSVISFGNRIGVALLVWIEHNRCFFDQFLSFNWFGHKIGATGLKTFRFLLFKGMGG